MKPRAEMDNAELHEYLMTTAAQQSERAKQLYALSASEAESAAACEKAARQLYEEAAALEIVTEVEDQPEDDDQPLSNLDAMRRDDRTANLLALWLA